MLGLGCNDGVKDWSIDGDTLGLRTDLLGVRRQFDNDRQ